MATTNVAALEGAIWDALRRVKDPELGRDVVTLNMIRDLSVQDSGQVELTLVLTTPACPIRDQFQASVKTAVEGVPGVAAATVHMDAQVRGAHSPTAQNLAPGVRNFIAIASGKGGVGKSTVSVNLALALAKAGARVGLLDADIYGPNVPLMMGVHNLVQPTAGDHGLIPVMNYGIKMISMGFFIPEGQAVVWRGPMIHGAIQQLLRDVDWGELDYMIIDLPPGTGDASLSLAQLVPLTGAVIVITPQDVAMQDASKAIHMFNKLNVPILGLIENMAYFVCPNCSEEHDIFGRGGGKAAARRYGLDFLGELPLDPAVRIGGDSGKPVVVARQDSPVSIRFDEAARAVASKISIRNMGDDMGAPVMLFKTTPKK